MKWFNNMKIVAKLIMSFIIVAIIAGTIGAIGVININLVNNNDTILYEQMTVPISQLGQISTIYQRQRVILRDILQLPNVEDKKKEVENIRGKDMEIEKLSAECEKLVISDNKAGALFETLKNLRTKYLPYRDKIIELSLAKNEAEAINTIHSRDIDNAEMAVQDAITNLLNYEVENAKTQSEDNDNTTHKSVTLMVMLIGLGMVLAVLLGLFVSRAISKPIKRLMDAANKLSNGDLDINLNINTKDEVGSLANAFEKIIKSINNLTSDANMLAQAAVEGKFDTRADATKHLGDYRKIVEGVNATLDTVVDKTSWYEAIIDAVPFPIHVTDNNMNWTYMNKAFEKTIVDAGTFRDRKECYGKACSNAEATICNTEKCGIKQLHRGIAESYFDWGAKSCKQDTSYLKNRKGESVGYVEVVTDLTSILRVSDYTKLEVEHLAINLDMLAKGDMNLNLEVKDADEYTKETREGFVKINVNLEKATSAVREVIKDALMLSNAAVEGMLSTRADVSKHQGDYRKIVEGVNATLDAVIHPLNEAEQVMKRMSLNDYTLEITGQYKGMLHEFADSINGVRTRLLSLQDVVVRVSKGDTSRLEEFHKLGKRSENDKLMPAVTGMMETIQNLIQEAGKLATSAVNGDLSIRGDVDKFEGGYAEVIEGMNRTMNAVAQPLKEAASVMLEMEKGNLTVSMNGDYKGEYAKMKEALNSSIQSFNDVLNEINTAAQQVSSGARQVSDSAQALSQGSTEQASSVEELTASLEEISSQTKQNAVNATQADHLAITAKENAVQGNEQMLEMLKAMEEINESSSNISKIIKVIDEIAFQTNILALNAAVEAARAGQHGKGFAVVAEEVRNLAARSANAAKETTGLIEGSIKKSEGGTKIANETALALNKIVDGVAKAASLVGEIASASNEQAAAIAQINQGIMQVSQVTQTNSATSEESAAASEELSSQAELLNELVGKFNLKKSNLTIKNLDELSPELLRMLENMSEKKRLTDTHIHEKKAEVISPKMKIALSDSEFGKY